MPLAVESTILLWRLAGYHARTKPLFVLATREPMPPERNTRATWQVPRCKCFGGLSVRYKVETIRIIWRQGDLYRGVLYLGNGTIGPFDPVRVVSLLSCGATYLSPAVMYAVFEQELKISLQSTQKIIRERGSGGINWVFGADCN